MERVMLAPGSIVKRRSDKARFTVLGVTGDGEYVITRADSHESPVSISAADLRSLFGARAEEPAGSDPQGGWDRLAGHLRAIGSKRRPMVAPTPEQELAAAAEGSSAAAAVADAILADPDKLGDYEIGVLTTHAAVARHIDAALAERDE